MLQRNRCLLKWRTCHTSRSNVKAAIAHLAPCGALQPVANFSRTSLEQISAVNMTVMVFLAIKARRFKFPVRCYIDCGHLSAYMHYKAIYKIGKYKVKKFQYHNVELANQLYFFSISIQLQYSFTLLCNKLS